MFLVKIWAGACGGGGSSSDIITGYSMVSLGVSAGIKVERTFVATIALMPCFPVLTQDTVNVIHPPAQRPICAATPNQFLPSSQS
jgi:hypothetical protein